MDYFFTNYFVCFRSGDHTSEQGGTTHDGKEADDADGDIIL